MEIMPRLALIAMKDLAGESDESDEEFDESGAHESWMTRLTNRADQLRVTLNTGYIG